VTPRASVVIATYNKAAALRRTLQSIFRQDPAVPFEVVVVNDGSADATAAVCAAFPVRYQYLDRPGFLNPGPARNAGMKMARGDIIINQSDEVEHRTPNAIQTLVDTLTPTTCVFARVENVDAEGTRLDTYCSRSRKRPLFFLGAAWRTDLYAVGGNDEDFVHPEGGEDRWLAACLQRLGRTFVFSNAVVGWHYDHPRPRYSAVREQEGRGLAFWKISQAKKRLHPWTARSGAWACDSR
jgi:glycosyltransferase involved in cell wall biosynthesis